MGLENSQAARREFQISPLLSLRLESGKTVIYVAGRRFNICNRLLVDVPAGMMWGGEGSPASIDEAVEAFPAAAREEKPGACEIPPEVEFWGHCSNLQAWADANYDTRLLHRNLAFPLLKALAGAGDPQAQAALGREVAARLASGHPPVVEFLLQEDYWTYVAQADLGDLPAPVLAGIFDKKKVDLTAAQVARLREQHATISRRGRLCGVVYNGRLNLRGRVTGDISNLEGWDAITALRELDLAENKLAAVPESLGRLAYLWYLDLSYNRLTVVPESLGQLAALRDLNLSYNRLAAVPESLGRLASLQSLYLSNNHLTAIPDFISFFRNLIGLDLSYNALTNVPESIGRLSILYSLNLSSNKLETLPDSLGCLSTLHTLDLSDNKLKVLPDSLGNLRSLETLHLDGNLLTTLPGSFHAHKNLQFLDLSNNQFTTVPEVICSFDSLEWFNLWNNRLATVPEKIGQLSSLKTLVLRCNQLISLPISLGTLHALEFLDLSNNNFRDIPVILGSMKSLRHIDLSGNNLFLNSQIDGELLQNLTARRVSLKVSSLPLLKELIQAMHNISDWLGVELACQQALALNPNDIHLWETLADALEAQGKVNHAVFCWEWCLKNIRSNPMEGLPPERRTSWKVTIQSRIDALRAKSITPAKPPWWRQVVPKNPRGAAGKHVPET